MRMCVYGLAGCMYANLYTDTKYMNQSMPLMDSFFKE